MKGLRMDELSAEVEVLESRLNNTKLLTTKISLSLQKLSASAQQVEQAVKPIHRETQALSLLTDRIDSTISAIERVQKPTDAVSQEEGTIRRGPEKVGLSQYLASLKNVNESLTQLKQSNLRSSQKAVQQMTGLLKAGSLQLEELFRQTLAEDSQPIEPLHYLTKELPFPTFSSQKINTLAVLNDFLSSTLAAASGLQSNATSIYAEVRGPYITSSLSSLALATINTTRRTASTVYERGSNGIGMYTSSLEAIFDAEYENICHLFPSSSWSAVYHGTTSQAMSVFKRTVQDLNTFISRNMSTDMFLAYEVIECVQPTSQRLKDKTGEQREFTETLKPIRQTAQGSFAFVLEDLKRQGAAMMTLPVDYTVAEICKETMMRLQKISEYQASICGLLISLGDGNWKRAYDPSTLTLSNFDVGADGGLMLSHFLLDVVDQLITELEQKAQGLLKKKSNIAVFMVNNVAFIETSIRRSELYKIMTSTALSKVERWRKDAVKMYMEAWKECAAFLMDVTYTAKQAGQKPLSGKEKEGVKDKFKNFNVSFEELVQKHKGYTFPDKDVRAMLSKEIGFVSPLYGRFYEKYKDTINPKHVKFDRQALEVVLSSL
ncbi:Cullin repeat-like-containing domain protein [Pyronema domesticum]|uniref:Exocyst complex protein EXO70 n=1 Tax=Pyronema omphalodes (strain CBS 100304) TaxID=1076935 RepID=U4LH75_PYROM|nr:Cullin repeat-like-containing domain protein [Pyronema domesticum]CCX30862.1 Similar to Exocyst complex protein exo70; acc. no. Q4X0X6 [Pyronema omphalodes CBS 100304]